MQNLLVALQLTALLVFRSFWHGPSVMFTGVNALQGSPVCLLLVEPTAAKPRAGGSNKQLAAVWP